MGRPHWPGTHDEWAAEAAKGAHQHVHAGQEATVLGIKHIGGFLYRRPKGMGAKQAAESILARLQNDYGLRPEQVPGLSAGNRSKYETVYREYMHKDGLPSTTLAPHSLRTLYAAYQKYIKTGELTATDVIEQLEAGELDVEREAKKQKKPRKDTGSSKDKGTPEGGGAYLGATERAQLEQAAKNNNRTVDSFLEFAAERGSQVITGDAWEAHKLLWAASGAETAQEFKQWARQLVAREALRKAAGKK